MGKFWFHKKSRGSGRNFYVDFTNGNDANDGQSIEAAWKTISKVNAYSFIPRDNIRFKCGESWNEQLIVSSSGSSVGYITYTYYGFGPDPIINGTGISIPDGGLVQIVNKNFIRIQHLNVINSDDFGIWFFNCNNVEASYNTTRNTHASGVSSWSCNYVALTHNNVVNARCVTLANGGHEESISLDNTEYFEVAYNDVSMDSIQGYVGNEGIDCKAGTQHGSVHHNYIHGFTSEGGALYVDAWDATTGDIDIYCNKCWGNPNGIVVNSEEGGLAYDINIYNNQIYNVYDTGIGVMYHSALDGLRRNIKIYHNSIYKNQYNGGAAIFISATNIESILVVNNITHFGGSNGQIVSAIASVDNVTAYNNLSFGSTSVNAGFMELSTNPDGHPTIHDNVTDNPDFVSTVIPDLHLQAVSPAIGTAYDYGLATDFDGVSRTIPDKGAYQYQT